APVGPVRRMGATEYVERLLVAPHLGQRAAIPAQQLGIFGVLDRGLFEHRHGLRALAGDAQHLRVLDGGGCVARTAAVAFRPVVGGPLTLDLALRDWTGSGTGAAPGHGEGAGG